MEDDRAKACPIRFFVAILSITSFYFALRRRRINVTVGRGVVLRRFAIFHTHVVCFMLLRANSYYLLVELVKCVRDRLPK